MVNIVRLGMLAGAGGLFCLLLQKKRDRYAIRLATPDGAHNLEPPEPLYGGNAGWDKVDEQSYEHSRRAIPLPITEQKKPIADCSIEPERNGRNTRKSLQ